MEDYALRKNSPSLKYTEDLRGAFKLARDNSGEKVTIYEENKKDKVMMVNRENIVQSDPGVYYVSTKRKVRKLKKTIPKNEAFRVGRISSWNEG